MKKFPTLLVAGLALVPLAAFAAPVVTSVAGAAPANIQAAVDAFRGKLAAGGVNNNVGGGPFAAGFRNINWDAVPDTASAPAALPLNFFNANSPRGAVFTTTGVFIRVSAKAGNPTNTALRFGDLDPSYATIFQAFSAERLFTGISSTVVDQSFTVPTSPTTSATTNGFGVVFCDVDLPSSTSLEFFDVNGASLGTFFAPVANNGLSFLGVFFDAGERVARVRITSGNVILAPGALDNPTGGQDAVAMDDFMYGEPLPLVSDARMLNVSVRGNVGGANGALIAGFVIGGTQPKLVMVRGVGPTLAGFGVAGAVANPQVSLFSGSTVVAANDDWGNNAEVAQAAVRVGAFPLPANSADSALLAVLSPGIYTIVVNAVTGPGQVLAEVYEVK